MKKPATNALEVLYNCPSCGEKAVTVKMQKKSGHTEISVKKCTACKYQAGLKQITKENKNIII